jgi:hypothetical protein
MLVPTAVGTSSFSDAGVIIVIVESSSRFGFFRTFGSLSLVILGGVAFGCDSSSSSRTSMPTTKVLKEPLPPEKLEKWVGEGATKHKEAISREERLKLIHEASQKQ